MAGVKEKAIRMSFWVGAVLMMCKFFAFHLTSSIAILTDALESIINVIAAGFAWFSLRVASRPRSKAYPYGFGKIEYISAGFEGSLILIAAGYILYKAILALYAPRVLENLDTGIILTVISGIINYWLAVRLIRIGKEKNSITLIADGRHLLTDTWSSVGLVAGLGLVFITNIYMLDAIISIILGLSILYTGYHLIRESLAGLMDEADIKLVKEMITVLNENRKESWIDIHNLRLVKHGANYHFDGHLTLPWYLTLQDAHTQVSELQELVTKQYENTVELFIHADPCMPFSCPICSIANCVERKQPFVKRMEWDEENLFSNAKHNQPVLEGSI